MQMIIRQISVVVIINTLIEANDQDSSEKQDQLPHLKDPNPKHKKR